MKTMIKPDNFLTSWVYLWNHRIFKDDNHESRFQECMDVFVFADNDIPGNVYPGGQVVNLECGPFTPVSQSVNDGTLFFAHDHVRGGIPGHDIDIDSWGKTFEEAIVLLAGNVWEKYGPYDPGAGPYPDLAERWNREVAP